MSLMAPWHLHVLRIRLWGLQVFCCFAQSVASTRWMLQDEMHIQNTPCDNCLIGTMIFMQQLSCICNIVACVTGSDEIAALADVIEGACPPKRVADDSDLAARVAKQVLICIL